MGCVRAPLRSCGFFGVNTGTWRQFDICSHRWVLFLTRGRPSQTSVLGMLRSTRASVPAANVADTTGASSTQSCRQEQTEVPMPGVQKSKRAKRICNGAARVGEWYHNTTCSRFVLIALCVFWTYLGQAAFEPDASLSLSAGMKVTLQSTRASVPAANVADTTGASSTQSCRHFHQA